MHFFRRFIIDGNNGTVKWFAADKGHGLISNGSSGVPACPPSRAPLKDPLRRAKVAIVKQPHPQKTRANVCAAYRLGNKKEQLSALLLFPENMRISCPQLFYFFRLRCKSCSRRQSQAQADAHAIACISAGFFLPLMRFCRPLWLDLLLFLHSLTTKTAEQLMEGEGPYLEGREHKGHKDMQKALVFSHLHMGL